MRELAVYYCPQCGHYGYFQLPKNAVCPKCDIRMVLLPLSYLEFMNLDCKERDKLLAQRILDASSSSVVKRLTAPHKAANNREVIAQLTREVERLEAENKKLNNTVEWMHQTIWDLVRQGKKMD